MITGAVYIAQIMVLKPSVCNTGFPIAYDMRMRRTSEPDAITHVDTRRGPIHYTTENLYVLWYMDIWRICIIVLQLFKILYYMA